jgi:Bacteriophage head to tail connecting protein
VLSASAAPYENASAAILAAQPVFAASKPPASDWPEIFAHLEGNLSSKRSWRYSWWQHWAILAQYELPYRYHWVIAANTFNRGFPVNDSIINNTATLAAGICANGLFTGLMSPSRPWFKLSVAIEDWPVDAEGQDWLDDSTDRILAVLSSSNLYSEAPQMFLDMSIFGTGPLIIYEDIEDVVRFYLPCAGEYFCGSGARNDIVELDREFNYTVRQIVNFFHLENCPDDVRQLWEQGGGALDREFVVAHTIEPNFAIASRSGDRRPISVVPGSFPYREVYWLRGRSTERELWRRGYREKPFICPRCTKTSNDPYGRSFGMDALGDTREVQQLERRIGEYAEKGTRPPMGAPVELENKPSSILPGEITFFNSMDGKQKFEPLFEVSPQWMPALTAHIEKVENRINRAFKTDLFMMISQMEGIQPKNQLELSMRQAEKIQQIGPTIELFEQEASVMIQRVMGIMARRPSRNPGNVGMFKRPPASLRGAPLGITYTSQMKLMQKAAQTASMERLAGMAGSISEAAIATQGQVPNPIRIVKWDDFLREYGKLTENRAKLFYTPQEVAEMDKQRAQQAQEQQMAAMALPAAQAGETLSKTPVGAGQSALGAVLGTQAPPQ